MHALLSDAGQILRVCLQRDDSRAMRLQIWMLEGRLETFPVIIHKTVLHPAVQGPARVYGAEMGEKAGGEIAVSTAPFMNHEGRRKFLLRSMRFVKLLGESMRQPIVTARHRLRIVSATGFTQSIEHRIQMSLPFINRLKLPDTLRRSLFVGRGWTAHGGGILTNHGFQDNHGE